MSKKLKRGYSLFLIILLLINVLFSNTVLAIEFEHQKDIEGTSIGGIISSDTTLELEKSPYILTEDIQVAYGATLTIEPGVIIKGNNNYIKVWGNLNAIGTEDNKITFNDVKIKLNGTSQENSFMDIRFAEVNGGSIASPSGGSAYGSFNLRDSHIKNTQDYMYVWYPKNDVNIERNIFENSGGISVGTNGSVKVAIRNNVFYKQTSNFAIENWASYDSSETIVEYNSFMSTDRIALRLPSGYNNAKMTAINNYWNTNDTEIIDSMIFDKKDDLASATTIKNDSFILNHHENTPKVNFSELNLVITEPVNGDKYFEVDKEIALRFNHNIQAGELFNEIVIKDNNSNIINIKKEVVENVLKIKPNEPLLLNTEYSVEIPMTSIKSVLGEELIKDYSFRFKTANEEAITVIGGIILNNITLGADKSPYILTEDIQIAYGATLTIEPGVIIKGNNNYIKVWGNLNAIGTEDNKITFNDVKIKLNGTSQENSFMDIRFAEVNGGSIASPSGGSAYGSFNLRDSHIKNTQDYMYVWYPKNDVNIERNIFENSGGISVGTNGSVKVAIRNNVFYKQTSNFAIENWASYDSSETIVEYNSFMSTDRIALRLPSGYDNAKMTAINNYWNTNDTEIIDGMIFDKKDDLGSAGEVFSFMDLRRSLLLSNNQDTNYISYEPFLINKHENTPMFDYENPILSYFDLYYLKDKVMVDKLISIKFNKDIFKGTGFEKVILKDKDGNIVQGNVSINGNELNISPKEYMLYNKEYKIEISKESIMDVNGNYIESDYGYEFTTEGPRTDLDNNSESDILDLAMLANKYNMTSKNEGWNSLYDFNGDKVIDIFDLVILSREIQ